MRTNYILPFRNQKYETFFFRNNFYKEALPRANPPTLVVCINIYTYININTYIHIYTRLVTPFPRAQLLRFPAQCARALFSSARNTRPQKPSCHRPSPFLSALSTNQPGKNRGEYSNLDGLHPSVSPRFSGTPLLRFFSIYVSTLENQNGAR